jgi:hypothetical protein
MGMGLRWALKAQRGSVFNLSERNNMADYFTNFSLVLKLANEGKRYQRCGVGSEGKVAFFLSALNPGETSSWQAEALEPGCSSSRANDGGRQ